VVRQKFGMATDSVYTVSGIMGLGYGYGYTIDYYNVLDTLVVYNYINGPVFSTALGRIGEGLSASPLTLLTRKGLKVQTNKKKAKSSLAASTDHASRESSTRSKSGRPSTSSPRAGRTTRST